MVNVLNGWLA